MKDNSESGRHDTLNFVFEERCYKKIINITSSFPIGTQLSLIELSHTSTV